MNVNRLKEYPIDSFRLFLAQVRGVERLAMVRFPILIFNRYQSFRVDDNIFFRSFIRGIGVDENGRTQREKLKAQKNEFSNYRTDCCRTRAQGEAANGNTRRNKVLRFVHQERMRSTKNNHKGEEHNNDDGGALRSLLSSQFDSASIQKLILLILHA